METFRFFNFPVYSNAKEFYKRILVISDNADYNLKDQIRRASLSIVLNIAEGSAKQSDKDFARYLQNSLGSVNEVVACLDILLSLNKIRIDEYKKLILDSESIAKQLGGFIKRLYNVESKS